MIYQKFQKADVNYTDYQQSHWWR